MDAMELCEELKLWAKDDIVPADLQELCKQSAHKLIQLQVENEQEYSRGYKDGLEKAGEIITES